ncbi:antiviral helicase [Exidia glandulosa HHB12029]|uniref:Antiviral helicase n=1 Tax=Exidia glandulosa HHB12029 TaxID=1314781 RepID=A0A165NWR5_EXIGL|nr:antiviral helicase [Exidia glandulosa HHB12029]
MDLGDDEVSEPVKSRKKRRKDSPDRDAPEPATTSEPASKKARIATPEDHDPVVLDEFETVAKREVAASAGLTGTVEADQRLELRHQVRHQVAVPPSYPYIPISQHVPPADPAKTYSFTLDPFQQVSVHAIQRNESVLVSAHTSAGKTAVAEYAIAQCLKNKQRVIYTSPIKALSNQKYRDFKEQFGDVGLMTGDITIDPSASCLVMTTEILRSMLYRRSDVIAEVGWLVFDEIHWMRDSERGVVWEETIILLPHTVHHVFLSATIPNAMEFAEWVCKLHGQPCHVVYTDFRPTPLQHYLFPAGGEGIYLVVNEKGEFREDNFQKAMGMLLDKGGEDPANAASGRNKKGKTKTGGEKKAQSDISKIVKMILLKNYHPVIIFAFSKRDCEALALNMSKVEINTKEEQEMVSSIFTSAIDALNEADRGLPQISQLLPLLKRGIGIHHGGLLPILKEVIEILFQEGLIKVLFATETFSIGLNMPAKTVVFTSVRKFDGKDFRNLSGGEYIQMSGRAGRRGLDDRGVVIMMCDEQLEPAAAKGMVKGEADRLDSAFHLSYNMILNLMRVEGVTPEYMLEKCFFQFQTTQGVPKLEKELREAQEQEALIKVEDEAQIKDYYELRQQLDVLQSDFRDVITHPTYCLPFLQVGRLVKVKHEDLDFGWGVVINYQKRLPPKGKSAPAPESVSPQSQYIVDVLLNCASGTSIGKDARSGVSATPSGVRPPPADGKSEPVVVPVLLSTIDAISHLRIHLPKDLRPRDARDTAWRSVKEVQRRFPDGIGLLDPVENMGIKDDKFKTLVRKIASLEKRLFGSPLHGTDRLPVLYDQYHAKVQAGERVKVIKRRVQQALDVTQMEELKSRKRVLRRLGFTTADDIVDTKGRVACEISTGDELLLTELVFNGVFNDLSPEHCAALLSCFVFDEKSDQQVKLREELAAPLRILQETARRIAKVARESKLSLVEEDYVLSFKVELMEAVMLWCRGSSFAELLKLTEIFEGSLIRVFRRLQELLRQMTAAARAIGNDELENKFKKASEMLERPNSVIFCSSLYL